MLFDKQMDKEYLPITGLADFTKASAALALGKDNKLVKEGLVKLTSMIIFFQCYYDYSILFYAYNTNNDLLF